MSQEKWIILHNCPGPEPAWWGDDNKPELFNTHKEAVEELLDDHISTLEMQLAEVKSGDREPDEVDLECDEWVEPCTLHDDGCISLEQQPDFYNPKTYVR